MGAKRVRRMSRPLKAARSGVPTGNVPHIIGLVLNRLSTIRDCLIIVEGLLSLAQCPQIEANNSSRSFTRGKGANRVRKRRRLIAKKSIKQASI